MSTDPEKRVLAERTAPTATAPRVTVPDMENKDEEKSNPSLHSPVERQAGSESNDEATREEIQPAAAAGGNGSPLEKQLSEVKERSRFATALIMFSLCMCVFLAALDTTIITTALPTIAEDFHSSAGYAWIGSAFLLGAASSTPVWAKFSDIFGRKPILMVANVVFFVGCLVCAQSKNVGMLIAGRAVQGMGGGGLITLVSVSIGDLFSMRVRGMYYGFVGFVWAIASALGPLLGGVFTQLVTWRWCFYINIPFQAICFFIMVFWLKIHTPKTPLKAGLLAIDWLGCALVVGGIIMFLLALQFGGVTYPWNSAIIICLLVFSVVSLVLFAINEWRIAKYPIIPLHIFKYRSNIAVLLTCFCHGFSFIGGSYYLPLYFQTVLGHGPIISGVLLLSNVVSLSLFSVSSGMFIRKTGLYLPPIWFGMTLMTIGFGLYLLLDANQNLGMIIGFQIVAGIGTGPNFQAPLIALQTLVPPRDIAAAVATFQSSRNLATSMSIVIGSVVFQNALKSRTDQLTAAVGPAVANELSGFNAAASASLISQLPDAQRDAARVVLADSLRDMWIMYTVVAGVGLICSLFITKQTLNRDHTVHKTGLAVEEEKRKDREDARRASKAAKEARKASVMSGRAGSRQLDVPEDVPEDKRISAATDVTGDEAV